MLLYLWTLDCRYAEALLVIPKQLAVNAAKDATDLIAGLLARHDASQRSEDKADWKYYGLDLSEGKVRLVCPLVSVAPCLADDVSFILILHFGCWSALRCRLGDNNISHHILTHAAALCCVILFRTPIHCA